MADPIRFLAFSEQFGLHFNLLGRLDVFDKFNVCFRERERAVVFESLPCPQTLVRLIVPVKAGDEHPGVHHQWRQASSRTLRNASATIRSASPGLLRRGRAAAKAVCSSRRVGGLTGRISSPASPRSNTFTGPP